MRLAGNEGIGPDWLASGRVPGLDGLRALSIALVLFCHGAKTAGSPLPLALRERYSYGTLGVDIFFVISGFLITLLLLREESRNGTVSLRGFYTRRAFRILPAYFGRLASWCARLGRLQRLRTVKLAARPPVLAHQLASAYLFWLYLFCLLAHAARGRPVAADRLGHSVDVHHEHPTSPSVPVGGSARVDLVDRGAFLLTLALIAGAVRQPPSQVGPPADFSPGGCFPLRQLDGFPPLD